MSYRLYFNESLIEELRRIAREQLSRALAELDSLPAPQAIHQARKRCKKLRALLRLARPGMPGTFATENSFFRDAANGLSDLRDTAVLIQTYDKLLDSFADEIERRPFGPTRRHLTERHQALAREDSTDRIQTFRDALQTSLNRIERWTIDGDPVEALLEGEQKNYLRGRHALTGAFESDDPEAFHDWRKRVKDYGYHTQLFRELWKPVLQTRRRELDLLGELLGDDHDLAVLRTTLLDDSATFGSQEDLAPFLALLIRRQHQLRSMSRKLGRRLYAETPEHHSECLHAWHSVIARTE